MQAPEAQSQLTHAEANKLLDLVGANPTLINIATAYRRLSALTAAVPHTTIRFAALSTFTLDPMTPSLQLAALGARIELHPWIAPFGQLAPTLIDANSPVTPFAPDVVLIAARLADVVPNLYDGPQSNNTDGLMATVSDYLDQLDASITTYRDRSSATLLLQNFERPSYIVSAISEFEAAGGQLHAWRYANSRLRSLAEKIGNCHVMDYDALVARHGSRHWIDPRTELYGRIPIAAGHYFDYAKFIVRHLRPIAGRSKKLIVLDADNTLWGGILGDDGLDGIQLGHDFPGNAYLRFQRRLLALHQRGILLCIASKNEPGSVEHAVASHPEMILRPEHFTSMHVSWSAKPDAIRHIAETLNLGLDSFVFIDDSAVECAMMRDSLPDVMTVLLPDDPARFADVIESLDCFDQFTLSDEDRRRGVMYKAEADRRQLATTAVDLPTFYRSLQMRLTIGVNDKRHAGRAAQMTQRTNQFNMNTIRCVEDDIQAWIRAPDVDVFSLGLTDQFGDSGIVGLAVVRKSDDNWHLHMLLMSCRVLGRTIESTFVAWIANRARTAGVPNLGATFVSTPKNQPFADFYHKCAFESGPAESQSRQWVLDLDSADTRIPDWFTIEALESASR